MVAVTALSLYGCASVDESGHAVRLVGMSQLAPDLRVNGSLVGGISGIDYDGASGEWLLASDDRAEHGPTRFYRARLGVGALGEPTAEVVAMVAWTLPDARPYPGRGQAGLVADVEALRIDPVEGGIWYASEGDRAARVESFVRRAGRDGRYLGQLPYPDMLQIRPDCACGGRSNLGPEGISFSADGQHLWIAMEAGLIGDDPAYSRISLVDRQGVLAAQYAYPLDAAPAPALLTGVSDNGIAEILALGPEHLLVLERSGNQIGHRQFRYSVRLYELDLRRAAPLDPNARIDGTAVRPGAKRLLFDSGALPEGWADNYEAMAWGAPAGPGRRALVLASDNNFGGGPTRFLIFALAGAPR